MSALYSVSGKALGGFWTALVAAHGPHGALISLVKQGALLWSEGPLSVGHDPPAKHACAHSLSS